MGLMNRMTNLLKADAHGVVDALEDRTLLLRQAVRDAQQALQANRLRLAGLEEEQQELERHGATLDAETRAVEADVDLAMVQDQQELARFAVRKLIPLREQADVRRRRLDAVRERCEELAQSCAQQTDALRLLEAKAQDFRRGADAPSARLVADEEIELELLRRQHKQGGGHVA